MFNLQIITTLSDYNNINQMIKFLLNRFEQQIIYLDFRNKTNDRLYSGCASNILVGGKRCSFSVESSKINDGVHKQSAIFASKTGIGSDFLDQYRNAVVFRRGSSHISKRYNCNEKYCTNKIIFKKM